MNPILADLFRQNLWANLTLIDFCDGLTNTVLDITVPGTYGGIRDTLAHIAGVEERFLGQLTGRYSAETPPLEDDMPDLAVVREHARASGEGLLTYAEAVEGSPLVDVTWQGQHRQIPAALFLLQAINHATEHRAQIRTALTQAGVEPPSLDAWAWSAADE